MQLVLGSVDIGGTRASLSMQLAETLGIGVEDVKPKVVDTDSRRLHRPHRRQPHHLRRRLGRLRAGQDIRKQMVGPRRPDLGVRATARSTYGDDGVIRGPKDAEGKDRSFTFKQLAGQLPPHRRHHRRRRQRPTSTTAGPGFGGHIVDVEVDPDTGKVTVLRYTAVQDVGTAIHPSYVEGQIQGGVAQGVGMALTEEYFYDEDGRMLNSSFLDYRMPTALDLPMIETVLVEVPEPGPPLRRPRRRRGADRAAAGRRPGGHRRGDRRALQRTCRSRPA